MGIRITHVLAWLLATAALSAAVVGPLHDAAVASDSTAQSTAVAAVQPGWPLWPIRADPAVGWIREPSEALNPQSDPPDPAQEFVRFQLRTADPSLYAQPVPITSALIRDAGAIISIGLARAGGDMIDLDVDPRADRFDATPVAGFFQIDNERTYEGLHVLTRYFVARYTTESIGWVSSPISKQDLRSGDAMNLTIGRDPRGLWPHPAVRGLGQRGPHPRVGLRGDAAARGPPRRRVRRPLSAHPPRRSLERGYGAARSGTRAGSRAALRADPAPKRRAQRANRATDATARDATADPTTGRHAHARAARGPSHSAARYAAADELRPVDAAAHAKPRSDADRSPLAAKRARIARSTGSILTVITRVLERCIHFVRIPLGALLP